MGIEGDEGVHGKARAENNFMLVEPIRCMYACVCVCVGGVAFSSLLH